MNQLIKLSNETRKITRRNIFCARFETGDTAPISSVSGFIASHSNDHILTGNVSVMLAVSMQLVEELQHRKRFQSASLAVVYCSAWATVHYVVARY